MTALDLFSPATTAWFAANFPEPTEVQERGWPAVASGAHTLLCAPTGSGKTLAAFLWAVDRLSTEPLPPDAERCRVVYVSPLKALAVDVERNLRAPLRGIALAARQAHRPVHDLRVAVRTGDSSAAERRDLLRHPPDILVTTPESLYLLLTSRARDLLRSVQLVVVDEIHALLPTKRGAHLALSLERLAALTASEPQRVGLSATVRPLDEAARFLVGTDRRATVVDCGGRRPLELRLELATDQAGEAGGGADRPGPGGGGPGRLPGDVPGVCGAAADGGSASGAPSDGAAADGVPADGALVEGSAAAIGDGWPRPRPGIASALEPRLLDLVRSHRTTIVFVNSRRAAERLAARLNDLAGDEVVRAHHGSLSRERRLEVEDALKRGELRGIVATSSLELGIDMGTVDLVVLVESPRSVTAGLQRAGRSGHDVGRPSRAILLPRWRQDLVEAAVVAEGMLAGRIEPVRMVRSPLDVLAQQIVAMAAMEEWSVADLARLVRRAAPFADLGDRSLEAVLEMLAGGHEAIAAVGVRPRLVWDRTRGVVRGRRGSQSLAVLGGGTIPDRGLYPVVVVDEATGQRRRVGELDEEMVFETHRGEVFVLGATSWRVVDVTATEVQVVPAPGEPGKVAFWHGDALGRSVELGVEVGRRLRDLRRLPDEEAERQLCERAGCDVRAASALVAHLREQERASAVPDDRTVVVERFRDQFGDWRICVLGCWGARVHLPWALAVRRRLRERIGIDVQVLHADDGFVLRLPDLDRPIGPEELVLDPGEVVDVVLAELLGSSLFAARFRENAVRSLLLPRGRPGRRIALWQQRQRAHDLLQAAARHPDFPLLAETVRECLDDVFDVAALTRLMTDLRSRRVRVVVVDTERPSPFASSLLFSWIARFMYEGDAPLAEHRAQALSLDRDLLAELLGTAELRDLLDPTAVADLEADLQGLRRERWPVDLDAAHDLLLRLGDLSDEEAAERGISEGWLGALADERRAVPVVVAGERRWIAVEESGLYRDALGLVPPPGLPAPRVAPVDDALERLVRRFARTHVPFTTGDVAARFGLDADTVGAVLGRLAAVGEVVAGEFLPGRQGREWCHPEVLRRLRRRSLAAWRREIEPVSGDVLARFLCAWQDVGGDVAVPERALEVVAQLQGYALPASVLERDVLPARLGDGAERLLEELVALGEVVWVGRGSLGANDGRVALFLRSEAARLLPEPLEPLDDELCERLRQVLRERGACFFPDLCAAVPGVDPEALADALWDLVWSGEVTNDSLAPLRALTGRSRGRGRPSSAGRRRPLMRLTPPRAVGRWSLVSALRVAEVSPTERAWALATVLAERSGILSREGVAAEGVSGGFAGLLPVLRAMEEAGRLRRGWFVDGLSGSQFALPAAVDRLRHERDAPAGIVCLAATDPANPYGAILPWPASSGRPSRAAGSFVVLDGGVPRLLLERGGRSLLTFGEVASDHVRALTAVAGRLGRLEVTSVDGRPVRGSRVEEALREAGFGASPRGLVWWACRPSAVARSSGSAWAG